MKPPIAEPFATPPAAPQERSFRGDFFRCFLSYFCLLFGMAALVSVRLFSRLPANRIDDALRFNFEVVVVVTSLATLATVFFSVGVSSQGLRGNNFWGMKREVQWPEIVRVRFFWFGLPYAAISTARRRNLIWMTLLLNDKAGFALAVEELAPPDNPLRLFLSKMRGKGVS